MQAYDTHDLIMNTELLKEISGLEARNTNGPH